MSSPLRDIHHISDWDDNHLDTAAAAQRDSSSPDDSLPIIGDGSSPLHIPKHRLCKTKHSQVYFSDSDDQEELLHSSSEDRQIIAQQQPHQQPIQPTRFQQQHHRRHRQFHRTLFTPFDLRQLNTTEAASSETPTTPFAPLPPTTQQQSSDETDATTHDLDPVQSPPAPPRPHHQSYRDSPGHHRIGHNRNSPSPPNSSVALQLSRACLQESRQRRRSRIMLINYGPESICVLALILTTFATFQNV